MRQLHELKLEKRFWVEIMKGNKHYDFRKKDKDFINSHDQIDFIDLETKKLLGRVVVLTKREVNPKCIDHALIDLETIAFIEKNYLSEPKILQFMIRPLSNYIKE